MKKVRNKTVSIRRTDEEAKILKAKAEKAGYKSVSDWTRSLWELEIKIPKMIPNPALKKTETVQKTGIKTGNPYKH